MSRCQSLQYLQEEIKQELTNVRRKPATYVHPPGPIPCGGVSEDHWSSLDTEDDSSDEEDETDNTEAQMKLRKETGSL